MARVPVVHLNHRSLVVASLKESAPTKVVVNSPKKKKSLINSRVLILGGTGRVGGSTAIALSKLCPDLRLLVAGRNREKGASLVATLGENSDFVEVDLDNVKILEAALNDVDLVVHAAGPFQQTEKCKVLEAAISTQTAYLDVCDDTNYAWRAKSFHEKAVAANIPAITTGGIYPGVSNVMAAELVRNARSESKEEPERLSYETVPGLLFLVELKEKVTQSLGHVVIGAAEALKEGTGGAGPTILATSFLLLGEEVVAYNQGEKIKLKPYSGMLNIDFGNGIRKRDVYLLNLPEVSTTHKILGVPSVSARFGTAPFFWNWGMEAMTRLVPAETLRDKAKVQKLVQLFDPVVRAIDGFAGERVSMRVDLECSNGRHTVGIFSHKRLSVSVGTSTAAFALAMLEGSTQPGVWFPEEPEGIAVEARELLLKRAAEGTFNFAMNKSPWMVESNPKEFGLGIYV